MNFVFIDMTSFSITLRALFTKKGGRQKLVKRLSDVGIICSHLSYIAHLPDVNTATQPT